MADGDVFLLYVPVDVDYFEGAFSGRRELGCFCVLVFLLYDEDFVSTYVGVMDSCLVLLLVVGNRLSSALQFEELPVNFDTLPENHV